MSTFYKFVEIADPAELRPPLMEECSSHRIKGSILVAYEGINGTISGDAAALASFLSWLRSDPRFADLETKESPAAYHPFGRLKVKVKSEIVSLGIPEASPSQKTGTYVRPEKWNTLIQDPEVVLVDTRNAYEVRIGTFKGAIDPKTRSFRQFPAFVKANLDPKRHPKIAMFCTGGIRCEKASSYLLTQGFKGVYQLEGGILKYLETIPRSESLWQGECFVFDERVALAEGMAEGTHRMCRRCGGPALVTGVAWTPADEVICSDCADAAAMKANGPEHDGGPC